MHPTFISVALAAGLIGFFFSIYERLAALMAAKQVSIFNSFVKRFWKMLEFACAQKKFFKHGIASGIMHAFIFWGFCAVAFRTIILFGQGFDQNFASSFLSSGIGHTYLLFKNLFSMLVIVGCLALLFRRIVLRPKRLTLSVEGNIILVTIIALMATDFMLEAGVASDFAYYSHIVLILGFLNWLPHGKHFHIITSLPNVFFSKIEPAGAISPLNLEDQSVTSFGVNDITGFNRKQILDLYSCTECGRCEEQCPAYVTEKPLSPKKLSIDLRDHLYSRSPEFYKSWTIASTKSENTNKALVGNVIQSDTIWSCTTCKACEEACPVCIEYVDKIVDMRRHQVLMEGAMTPESQTAMKNIETNSNPWGISHETRADWAKDLNVKILSQDSNIEYLYFVGCAGSFDERAKKISRAFVKLLQKAGVSFGILGTEEKCTGDSARRLGNEYLFQMLARENIAIFKKYGVKKIITTCPHCFNTIKNEYPQFGGNYEVYHHTEFLLELAKSGKINVAQDFSPATQTAGLKTCSTTVVYHDSCYLGRYNNIYDAPRELLKLSGHTIAEPEKTRDFAMCCGAGGGRMWMEEKLGMRINHKRLENLQNTGTKTMVSACPFCLTMLTDGAREKNVQMEAFDIAELL